MNTKIKSKLKFNKKLYLLIFVSILTIFIYFPLALQNDNYFSSPDENTMYFFSEQYSQNTSLKLDYNYDAEKTYGAIKPRMSILYNNNLVPVLPNGIIIITGTFQVVLTKYFILLFTPLIFGISIIYFYKLVELLFNERIAFISAIEFAVLAPFIYLATKPLVFDAAALATFIIAIYYFIKNKLGINFFLSGLFFGFTLFLNHKYVFLIFTFFVAQLISLIHHLYHNKDSTRLSILKFYIKQYAIIFLGFIPFLSVILYYNNFLYGSYLRDGYMAQSNLYSAVGGKSLPIFYIAFNKIFLNINSYLINLLTPLFSTFSLLGMLAMLFFNKMRNKLRFVFILFILLMSSIVFSYFASIASWGYDTQTISASFVRYLLPLYAFMIPLFVLFLITNVNKYLAIIVILTVNIFSFLNYFVGAGGYSSTTSYVNRISNLRSDVISHTSTQSIIKEISSKLCFGV